MYDSLSNNYDRFVNWDSRLAYEMAFLEQQLESLPKGQGNRILDAACGTGMHVIAMSRKGYQAFGADFSAAMVAKAKENAKEQHIAAEFKTAGFGSLAETFIQGDQHHFNALFCLGNSIPHILSATELSAALKDFANCLVKDGLVLIQNRNFDAVIKDQNRWMEPQSFKNKREEWVFLRFYDFHPDQTITFNILTLYCKKGEGWQQSVDSTKLYPWTYAQLSAALTDAGFTQVEAYGDMTGAAFDPETSGNLILSARVPHQG